MTSPSHQWNVCVRCPQSGMLCSACVPQPTSPTGWTRFFTDVTWMLLSRSVLRFSSVEFTWASGCCKAWACVQTACVQPISALFFTSNARLPETVDQTETVGFTCFLTWLSVQEMVFSHGLCRKLDVAARKNQLAAPICTDNVTSDG